MSSNYYYGFFIILSFFIMYLITIYIQTLYAFKKDYAEYKCNPLMMPFAASFGENPVDVFNECLEAQQQATTDDYTSSLFTNLDNNNTNTTSINDMSSGVITNQSDFKTSLYGPSDMSLNTDLGSSSKSSSNSSFSGGTIPGLMNAQQNMAILTTKMVSKSKNIMDVIMANLKAILLSLEAAPVMAKGITRSPPIQLVQNVGALAGG